MNRGRATTGGYSSPRGRPSRASGHPSLRNRHVTGADGSFSDGSFCSRGGMSHGRRGNAGRVSPGSFPRYSNHRPKTVNEYWVRKTSEDESFHTEGLQQNRNASNSSGSESKQSECFVASDCPHGGDSARSSASSSSQGTQLYRTKANIDQKLLKGVVDGGSLHLDFKHKGNIAPLQNESQPSLQFGAKHHSESKQSECFVASDSPHGGDSARSSASSSSQGTQLDRTKVNIDQKLLKGVVDGGSLHLDFKYKVNIASLQNESQPSLLFGAKHHSESKQSEYFVASDSPHCGDSARSSASTSSQEAQLDRTKANIDQKLLKGVVDGGSLHLDFKGKVNIAPLQNESQLSLQFGAKHQPPREQCAKSAGSTEDPGHSNNLTVIEPFDICHSRTGTPLLKPSLLAINRQKRNETKHALEGQGQVLEPGMILLKGCLSMDDQVKIVKLCQGLGLGPGGFYQPGYRDGAKLLLKMMCLGRNWDPNTSQYGEYRAIDGAKPPDIPREFHCLVERAMKDSHALVRRNSQGSTVEDILPWMIPDICIVNFYSASGRLGLHQDKDESERSLKKGLPVVSFSIGDAGEFLYGDNRDEKDAKNILLESGDVLIFGGKSRHIFHGVRSVHTDTTPKSLLQETNLRPGRLNLTFRQY